MGAILVNRQHMHSLPKPMTLVRKSSNQMSPSQNREQTPTGFMSLLRRGLESFKEGWRAKDSNGYIGGLGKRRMSAQESLGRWKDAPRALFSLFVSLSKPLRKRGVSLCFEVGGH